MKCKTFQLEQNVWYPCTWCVMLSPCQVANWSHCKTALKPATISHCAGPAVCGVFQDGGKPLVHAYVTFTATHGCFSKARRRAFEAGWRGQWHNSNHFFFSKSRTIQTKLQERFLFPQCKKGTFRRTAQFNEIWRKNIQMNPNKKPKIPIADCTLVAALRTSGSRGPPCPPRFL